MLPQNYINCKWKTKTFNQAAARYFQVLEKAFIHSDTIIDVFDQYPTNAIKEAERQRRAKSNNKVYQVIGGRSVPPWDRFMATSDNKKAVSDFISSFICEYRDTRLCNSTNKIVLAGGFINGETTTLKLHGTTLKFHVHMQKLTLE